MWAQGFGMLLVTLLILIVLFLIGREVVCWYWKINEGLSELQRIRSALEKMSLKLETADRPTGAVRERTGATNSPAQCGKCGKPLSPGVQFCEYCGAPATA